MASTFDAVSTSADASSVTTITWTHTPVGTPTAVGVVAAGDFESSPKTFTSATYAGGAAASEVTKTGTAGADPRQKFTASIFGQGGPSSGAQAVVVNSGSAFYGKCGAITVTGSDTSTVFSNHANGLTGSNLNTDPCTVTCTSATNELVVDCVMTDSAVTCSPGGSQTSRINATGPFGFRILSSTIPGAASVTMTWTTSGTAGAWTQVAAAFKAAAAGGGVVGSYYYCHVAGHGGSA